MYDVCPTQMGCATRTDHELLGGHDIPQRVFVPTDVTWTIGGLAEATVKKECGARFGTPPALSVDIHAIGRGTTSAASSR
jgi:hypothetical protein